MATMESDKRNDVIEDGSDPGPGTAAAAATTRAGGTSHKTLSSEDGDGDGDGGPNSPASASSGAGAAEDPILTRGRPASDLQPSGAARAAGNAAGGADCCAATDGGCSADRDDASISNGLDPLSMRGNEVPVSRKWDNNENKSDRAPEDKAEHDHQRDERRVKKKEPKMRQKAKRMGRSGVRTKFLIESLRSEMILLQQQNAKLRRIVAVRLPEHADRILRDCCRPVPSQLQGGPMGSGGNESSSMDRLGDGFDDLGIDEDSDDDEHDDDSEAEEEEDSAR